MEIRKEELIAILSQFNPWWHGEKIPDLPSWRREVFQELVQWIETVQKNLGKSIQAHRQTKHVSRTVRLTIRVSELRR